ncbi:MAG: hypothetical protein A2Y62_05955 [Candidatus Fischerbacteria bacterium RBG_13_37_8]|uniref:Ketosynthase family 3 (KS3) domain-containing protein n=1 Tax=Candidatus Fischerbacteria bacterium RBG_13_37_8 TaxID=1817863 RepID=A0A1F5V7N8_9BACT|nr:MAG: hypothetical protein A2Y62_05955 [Candidatus Fischerbacteria bacterium RBG_13_37_8]
MRRAVITGFGIISPIGNGKEAFFRGLMEGKSGIDMITLFDASTFPVRIAGEVKDFDTEHIRQCYPETRHIIDRKVLLGLAAVEEAIADAGLTREIMQISNAGINFGVCLEVLDVKGMARILQTSKGEWHGFYSAYLKQEENLQTPLDTVNRLIINRYGITGPDFVNCSACAASTQTIGHSLALIRRGEVNMMVCGGYDSMIHPLGVGGFALLGALSANNELRGKACRPFDALRDGAVLGEGAAMLVLEELQHAQRRNAKIYCEVAGFGSSLDAYKVTDPDQEGEGATLAMKMALRSAHISPAAIDYINAHGTSTPKNDEVETHAIKHVFDERAYKIPVSSTKSMTGHLIAAAGAVECGACLLAFQKHIIPPTINYEHPDYYCDLDYVPNTARSWNGKYILKNSFGFGGQNACLVLGTGDWGIGNGEV